MISSYILNREKKSIIYEYVCKCSETTVINIYENTNKKLNDMHLHW